MRAVLLTKDLLLGSQIGGAAKAANCDFAEVGSPVKLVEVVTGEPTELVIVDLTFPGVRKDLASLVPELKAAGVQSVFAYGPHVQEGALGAAEAAGCDRVLTRGQLHRELGSLFSS